MIGVQTSLQLQAYAQNVWMMQDLHRDVCLGK